MPSASSRERLLAAIDGSAGAPLPCCFMIFRALRAHCRDEYDFAGRQAALGLDTRVQLDDLPIRLAPEVVVREWTEPSGQGPPRLRRTYATPAGELTAVAKQTEDWPYGDRLPLFADYFTPRAVQYPVTGPEHLDALRALLAPPAPDDAAAFREEAAARRKFAEDRGYLLSAGWKSQRFVPGEDLALVGENGGTGTVVDALMWLCGGTAPLLWAYDDPDFLAALIEVIEQWNRARLEVHLETQPDLLIRRAWYESTDFWSPPLYRRFILPGLVREVELAHQAGARFGYIITTGMIHIAEAILEAGVDVIIGLDPAEEEADALASARDAFAGKLSLWGGVNGPHVVEDGEPDDVRRAVEAAVETLAPTGRFILCPVDNVRADTDRAWRNVETLIDSWRTLAKES